MKHILIIDDDKMTCNLIKKVFEKKYDVVFVHNGEEAIEFLKNSSRTNISCIFLDLIMPVLDGFSVLDYLNDNNYLGKLPVTPISPVTENLEARHVYSRYYARTNSFWAKAIRRIKRTLKGDFGA